LIKGLDNIHEITTRTVPNAAPPRFEFQDVDANTLMVTYKSRRNMIDFYVGLVKGVGKLLQDTSDCAEALEFPGQNYVQIAGCMLPG